MFFFVGGVLFAISLLMLLLHGYQTLVGGVEEKQAEKGLGITRFGETFEGINAFYRKQTHCGTVTLGR